MSTALGRAGVILKCSQFRRRSLETGRQRVKLRRVTFDTLRSSCFTAPPQVVCVLRISETFTDLVTILAGVKVCAQPLFLFVYKQYKQRAPSPPLFLLSPHYSVLACNAARARLVIYDNLVVLSYIEFEPCFCSRSKEGAIPALSQSRVTYIRSTWSLPYPTTRPARSEHVQQTLL